MRTEHLRRAALGRCVALCVCVLPWLGGALARADEPFAQALRKATNMMGHRSLHTRTRAWKTLAETQDARALPWLRSAYERVGEIGNGRALLVSIACETFSTEACLPVLSAWRAAHEDDSDADRWLWYRTLCCEVERGHVTAALAGARSSPKAWQRAVALKALAQGAVPEALELLSEEACALPPEPLGRAQVLESLAEVWAGNAQRLGTPEHRAAGLWLVTQLESPRTPERSKLVIVRVFARVLEPAVIYEEPAFWRSLLNAQAQGFAEGTRYAPPPGARFLDLSAIGRRVVYVIDVSGSMQDELSESERADLARVELPPARASGGPAAPWAGVRRRIDLAGVLLTRSLRALPSDAHFAVVVFASKHAFLRSTPGLVPASARNVVVAVREIERLVEQRDSALGRATNLHGGLARALQALPARGTAGSKQPDDLLSAPSTIFVLSDGSPCQDDWTDEEADAQKGRTVGPQNERGTFYDVAQLLDDVARLNLTRRCEIHCLGVGEMGPAPVEAPLLQRLAEESHGRLRLVPAPQSARVPGAALKAQQVAPAR